ncbi:hypothetical protein V2W45_1399781 [Cenococcum geophilum]
MSFGFSVVDFITAIELANKIRKKFVGAPKQFKDISDEVRSLSIILQDVDVVLSERELNDQQKKGLKDIVDACQNVLDELEKTLDKYSELEPRQRNISKRVKRAWKRLTWEPDDIRELRGRITLNVTLLNSFNERFTRDNVVKLVRRQDDRERRAILDWLTPIDYANQQNDFINRRQEGTGQWLLDLVEYQAWLKTNKQTLFCPGIPGAGKTILTSIVVRDLHERFRGDGTIGIAYIYCNFRRQDEQKADRLLASLLRQLSQERPLLADIVKTLYDCHKDKRTRPSLDEILGVLQSVAATYSRVFIIVDALDECQISDGCRQRFLSGLFNLQAKCGANLFATSRPISSIEKEFEGNTMLEIRASEEDVRRYLEGDMFRLPAFVVRSLELQEEIKTRIIKAVDGMFLLAQLHLESLIGKRAPKAVRTALKTLAIGSGAYDHAYEDAMEQINGQVKDQEELAKQVLWWITCAKRPLTTSELQHALAVEIGESQLDEDNLPQVEDMISVCAGLATVDEESNIIRLVHYTTQEYFERTQSRWFPNANGDIARICLTYPSFDTFNSGFCSTDVEFEERLRSNALYNYSALYWGYHFRSASLKPEELALGFLQSQEKLSAASQAMRVIKLSSNDACYSQQVPKQVSGVHLAAYFGLKQAILTLVELLHDPNVRDTDGQTPLWWAAVNGNEEEVKLLLDIGVAHLSSKDCCDRTPLTLAAMNGHEKVVKLLLATDRVGLEAKDSYGRTPLWWAAANGHEGVVKLLLATGRVEPQPKDGHGRAPSWLTLSRRTQSGSLLTAANRREETAKDIYRKRPSSYAVESWALLSTAARWRDARQSQDAYISWDASSWRAKVMWRSSELYMPVKNPVDSNLVSRTSSPKTWIRSAVNLEHDAVIKLLLARSGISIKSKDNYGRVPLLLATVGSQKVVMRLLLVRSNVDVNSDSDGLTPLWLVAVGKDKTVAKLLRIWNDINLKSKDNFGRTPMWFGAVLSQKVVGNLLLSEGHHVSNDDGTVANWVDSQLSYAFLMNFHPRRLRLSLSHIS